MLIKEHYSTDQQGGDTKWIETSVTDTQKHWELPLYTISDKVNRPFLVELQAKGNAITFEVDSYWLLVLQCPSWEKRTSSIISQVSGFQNQHYS